LGHAAPKSHFPSGYVTRFKVLSSFLNAFDVQYAGGFAHQEYWIPAESLPAFNAALIGKIDVVAEFHRAESS
jgi:hypothetical protein